MKRLDDVLNYGLKIYQDSDFFSFSIDSVVLGNYCNLKISDKKIIDLCTGNGIVPIILSKRYDKKIDCIEIQDKLVELAKDSFKENNIEDRINLFSGDINTFFTSEYNNYYDVVLCNPPYFNSSNIKNVQSLSMEKRIARHEIKLTLNQLITCVKKILKNNGTFYLVHRADRLVEILDLLNDSNLIPKRLFFVHDNINTTATLVFIESRMNGKPGLFVDKPLIMFNLDGSKTDDYNRLFEEVL